MTGALERVSPALRCPVCAAGVTLHGRELVCAAGHRADVARQGYVNLTAGRPNPGTGDTPDMVAARERFLGAGHFAPLSAALADAATPGLSDPGALLLDLAGGTGHHGAAVLDRAPAALGLCLDLSVPALRRAARAHPRLAAVAADAWQPLPVAGAVVDVVLSVFGPRTSPEIARVLRPGGRLVVASPAAGHLRELVDALGLIGTDPRKADRQAVAFAAFGPPRRTEVRHRLLLDRPALLAAAAMGPTGAHRSVADLETDVARLPERLEVGVAVDVAVYGG